VKILLVSDEENSYIWDFFQPEKFKDVELIISCGDLKAEYLSFLVTMIKAPLYYVHGNHDTSYSIKPPEGCEDIDGRLVKYKNVRILGLGGSHKYSSGKHQYTEKEMEKRINKLKRKLWINKGFDILVTHAPAFGIGDRDTECHRGFKCFNKLIEKYSPKYFFHGHIHLNYGNHNLRVTQYKNTKIVNAFNYYLIDI